MKKLKLLNKYSAAITFLALEFFTLLAFNFSGSFIVYGALSLALIVLLILFNIGEITVNGISNVGLFYIPIFIFTMLTAVSGYSVAHAQVGDFSYAELVFIPLGILPIAFAGYLLSIDRNFKIKNLLITIYGALALYVLLNLIVNLVYFGAFYPVIFKGYYMYYSGLKSNVPVNDFAYTLEGFKFIEVNMSHYVLYPALLLTSGITLIYLSPKKDKVNFIVYAVYTFIALLALILVPSLLSLASIVVIGILMLIMYFAKRFPQSRKVFKIILIVFVILFVLGYLVFIVNNQSAMSGISNIIKNNGLLNKLFNTNKYAREYNTVLVDIFSKEKIFGYAAIDVGGLYPEEVHLSGGFIFDSYMTSGVFGTLALILFIIVGFRAFKKYFYNHSDEFHYQAAMLLFAIFFIGFSAFFYQGEYALYYQVYKPIYMTAPFMVLTFYFAYVYSKGHPYIESKPQKKEETSDEQI